MPFYIGIVVILAIIWVVGVIVGPVTHNSLLILFGVYAVYKIVEHNSGSSSGSPYGKLSCVRAVLSAATELPLFAAIVLVYLKNRFYEYWKNHSISGCSWSFGIFYSF